MTKKLWICGAIARVLRHEEWRDKGEWILFFILRISLPAELTSSIARGDNKHKALFTGASSKHWFGCAVLQSYTSLHAVIARTDDQSRLKASRLLSCNTSALYPIYWQHKTAFIAIYISLFIAFLWVFIATLGVVYITGFDDDARVTMIYESRAGGNETFRERIIDWTRWIST